MPPQQHDTPRPPRPPCVPSTTGPHPIHQCAGGQHATMNTHHVTTTTTTTTTTDQQQARPPSTWPACWCGGRPSHVSGGHHHQCFRRDPSPMRAYSYTPQPTRPAPSWCGAHRPMPSAHTQIPRPPAANKCPGAAEVRARAWAQRGRTRACTAPRGRTPARSPRARHNTACCARMAGGHAQPQLPSTHPTKLNSITSDPASPASCTLWRRLPRRPLHWHAAGAQRRGSAGFAL